MSEQGSATAATPTAAQHAAQQELLRQRYLRQLGLTPWVAHQPLAQAATLPSLPLPARPATRSQSAQIPSSGQSQTVSQGQSQVFSQGRQSQTLDPALAQQGVPARDSQEESFAARALAKPASAAKARTPDAGTANDNAAASQPGNTSPSTTEPTLIFTLQAYAGERVHVWVEQQQADAPSLSREEGQLLQALLRAVGAPAVGASRRMTCAPTAGKPPSADDARQMLTTFARGLLGRDQGAKVLLCLSDATATALFQAPRYQPQTLAGVHFLPVSSLAEMLAEPVSSKRATWQAMLAHDFR